MNQPAHSRRGRPKGVTGSRRDHLLDVASAQIAAGGSAQLVLRDLTAAAGVTPALVHYYFGDLEGLLNCLLAERGGPLLQPLGADLRSSPAGAAAALGQFVQRWSSLLARQRWLLPCLMRRSAPQSPAAELTDALRLAVNQAQQDGAVRPDLPDHYVAMLLLALGALPQLSNTLLGAGLQLPEEPAATAQLTLLHLSLLHKGVAAS